MSFTKHGEIGPVPMKPSIQHFTHPGHLLTEVYGSEEFQCDGCKTPGNGPRYQCHICDFNMHKDCGVCPSTLSTFMHPQHQLKLVMRDNERFCNLCRDDVEGLFYRCTICDFNIHPLCTKLPEYVPHALHSPHSLKLQTSSSGWCRVCRSKCTSWRYGCGTCGFDIHLECILTRCDASTTSRSVAAPAPWAWDFNVGLTPHGAYHGPSPYYAYGPQHPYCSSTPPPPHYATPTHFGAYVHPYAHAPPPPSCYGVAPPTHFGAYVHPYAHAPPPPSCYGVAAPTHFGAYVHPYAYAPPPPPTSVAAPPPPPPTYGAAPPPPCHGACAHGESPGFSPHSANHSVSEAQGSGKPSKVGKRLGKIIYSLVGNLTVGLLCGIIFGI